MKKMLFCFLAISLLCFFASCRNNSDKETEKKVAAVDSTHFYPVGSYLNEDIKNVFATKAKIYKTVTVNKVKSDSVAIDSIEFNALAKHFFNGDISESPFKKFYKESVFRNLTTSSVVFNYSTAEPTMDIKSVDASLYEGESHFYRLDIREISQKNDSSIIESYCWLTGKQFYIIRYAEGKDKKGVTTTTTVTWNK